MLKTASAVREVSQLDFHMGHMLARVASTYPGLFENGILMELVQNAIDSDAVNIWVRIDLVKCLIVVQDDGFGASIIDFGEALGSVGETIKRKTRLGRFGIGLVSPMGKCKRFIFTSTPKSNPKSFNSWTFDCGDIEQMKERIEIPRHARPELLFARAKGAGVPWRTEMRIEQFRKDLRVQRLSREGLTRAIHERYSKALERNKTSVHVTVIWEKDRVENWDITAQSFRGMKLEKHVASSREGGNTEFSLHLSPKTSKGFKGTVLVGESANDFRIDFRTFLKTSAHDFLSEDVVNGFNSGIFEGEIDNSKIKLNPDRKSFEQNDALVSLCVDIDDWYKKTGSSYVEEAKTAKREERYQQLGVRSMKVLEELIRDSVPLMNLVKNLKVGRQGKGHTAVGLVIGEEKVTSMSTHPVRIPGTKTPPHTPGNGESGPRGTYPNDHPGTVVGPKGQRRTRVKSDSLGLQFCYEGLEGSNRLWQLDTNDGVITFNTRHPLRLQAEEGGDRALMGLQEQVVVHALHLELGPPEWREVIEMHLEEMLPSLIFLLLKADKIAGRRTTVHQLPGLK